jgi:hypothetical protein
VNPAQTAPVLENLDKALAAEGRSREGFEIVITPPYQVDEQMLNEFAALGVDRLVIQLGSQRSEKIEARMQELEALVTAAESL